MSEPCLICNRTDAWRDPLCDKHPEIDVTYANLTRVVSREEWNATVPLANALNAQLMDAYRESTAERKRLRDLSARFVWHIGDLRCPHGRPSGTCTACANGIDPTTGDVA